MFNKYISHFWFQVKILQDCAKKQFVICLLDY